MAKYMLTSTDGRGLLFALGKGPTVIGRATDATIPLPEDELASRKHCEIRPDGAGGLVVTDLGSRNGTKVNKQKIEGPTPLRRGDSIKVGSHVFAVEAEQSMAEARAEARATSIDAGGAGAVTWPAELRGMIESLAPRGTGADDPVQMVDNAGDPSNILTTETDGPKLMRNLLLLASKSRATDIHLEPKADRAAVRMRVDGQMAAITEVPLKTGELCVGVARAGCNMVAAAKDAAVDGHFSARFKNKRVDYRISITPSVHGPKLVLRVLDGTSAPKTLHELGLPSYMHDRVKRTCEKEHGLLLVSGPTGSGKTTTLYNALREIDRDTTNVVTIEDPVEYNLEGVTQIPVDVQRGNSFHDLLRSVLRQDPDVILVGEIRDEETARTAMQASITGHVVFTTIHAKDSISSVFRLLDLKVEPYLVANALDLVLAQRLVRMLCENCKRPVRTTAGQLSRIGRWLEGKSETFESVGCAQCLRTGYRGRRALFEMLDVTDELRDVILRDATVTGIKRVVERGLFMTLQQCGWQLAARGHTSLEEADRVAGTG
ncbi:MAG: ATPase, T2SS/T4P/T4SS family [Phycisphaerales bacterium]